MTEQEQMALTDVTRQQSLTAGTAAGGVLALLAEWNRNRDLKDRIKDRDNQKTLATVKQLQDQIDHNVPIAHSNYTVVELLNGLSAPVMRTFDGIVQPTLRPVKPTPAQAGEFTYPPYPTVRTEAGITQLGQNWLVGQRLNLPDIQATLLAFQAPSTPAPGDIEQIFKYWSAHQAVAASFSGISQLTDAQIRQLANMVANDRNAQQTLENHFTAEISQPVMAALAGMAGFGPTTQAQAQQIALYFNSLVQGAVTTPAAGTAWVPQSSPALADSALDVAWPAGGYASDGAGGYIATPTYSSAVPGGVVPYSAARVASAYYYGVTANDAQTVRSFAMSITAGSTPASGVQLSVYLPGPLKNQVAPKVTISPDGADLSALKLYVGARTGGTAPSFQLGAGAALSGTFRVIFTISE